MSSAESHPIIGGKHSSTISIILSDPFRQKVGMKTDVMSEG